MQNMGLGLKNVIDVFHWVHYILFAFILFFSQNVELCCLIQMQKGQTGQMYCTTGYIPSVPFGANRHTTLCLLHIDGGSSKQGGGEKKDQKKKKGGELTEEGIRRKVQDRSYASGICIILLTPSTPIRTLR